MKKVKKLQEIQPKDLSPEEFDELLKETVFKKLTPEEKERIDAGLPKSLRKGYRSKKKDDS